MKFEDARAAIAGRLNTAMTTSYPAIKVQYENRLGVDLATQVEPYVDAQVKFSDGDQMNMSPTPGSRYRGGIYLSVCVKEGEGTAEAFVLLGFLADTFKTTRFSGVTTAAVVPLPGRGANGWYVETLRVPFWFDDMP